MVIVTADVEASPAAGVPCISVLVLLLGPSIQPAPDTVYIIVSEFASAAVTSALKS